jgi:hypothetical protein
MLEMIGTFIAAFLTLMMFSFLYKDNPFYKFGEHLYLGVSVGWYICITTWDVLHPMLWEPLTIDKQWSLIFPTILGALMLTRFIRQVAWLSRWSMAYYIGFFAGLSVPSVFVAWIMAHIESTITTIIIRDEWKQITWIAWEQSVISQLIIVIGILCVLTYFYFSIEHKGIIGKAGRVGIYFIMIGFGAAFGYTVMARVSLLIGRVNFLIYSWIAEYIVPWVKGLFI